MKISISEKGSSAKLRPIVGSAQYPLDVVVANKTTIRLSLPEAGLRLDPLASERVRFPSFDALQRAVTSLEQLAIIHRKLIAEVDLPDAPAAPAEPKVTIVRDDSEKFIVEIGGVKFEPQRNQVREDGTLTTRGLRIYEAAKAAKQSEAKA